MKLFNVSADKFALGFNEGGLPYYNTDVSNSQDNAQLWGLPSAYRDYNMVLSGCLVDDCDLSGTISITEGYVMIQNIVYKVPSYSGAFPVEIKASDGVVEQRDFKSGETHDATITFSASWTTTVSTPTATNFPIIFKPFCDQRLDNYSQNMGKVLGELREIQVTKLTRSKTDTGKTIKNGSVTIAESGILAGWEQVKDGRATVASNNYSLSLGYQYGNYGVQLTKSHLPEHQHELTRGSHSCSSDTENIGNHTHTSGTYETDTKGSHIHKNTWTGDNTLDSGGKYTASRQNADYYQGYNDLGLRAAGDHKHDVNGNSGGAGGHDHDLSGSTGKGVSLTANNTTLEMSQPSIVVLRLKFVGYAPMFNHVSNFGSMF